MRGEDGVSDQANWPLCLMLRIGRLAKTERRVLNKSNSADLDLIVPNLHRRYSGVTATNRMVAPKLAKLFCAGWLGSNAPDGIKRIGFFDLLRLWRRKRP